MKKRHPHDVSDIDSPGGKHVHSSYRPLQRTETVLTVNNESNFDQHLKEKSTYEFGQPIFRRNLRKTVEVKAVYLIAIFRQKIFFIEIVFFNCISVVILGQQEIFTKCY